MIPTPAPDDFRPDLPPRRRAQLWASVQRGRAHAARTAAKYPNAGARVREVLAQRPGSA
ncbi:hypothetical protein ACFVJM_38130 [Streptomyces virginiae]|uniref:hypothetical protein n=1 Tax=Streptomyces virginiae TaxID=1961 RepID=UPI00362DAEA0